MRQLADVGSGDEGFVARPGQNHSADCGVLARVLEGLSQVLPRPLTQGVEHLRSIDGHIANGILLLVQKGFESCR